MDYCLICKRPVDNYKPDFCCPGIDCTCRGLPINPCTCSIECENAIFDFIGLPFDERRIKAGIKLYQMVKRAGRITVNLGSETDKLLSNCLEKNEPITTDVSEDWFGPIAVKSRKINKDGTVEFFVVEL